MTTPPAVLARLLAEARREYRDSDAAGDVLDWLEEQAASLAQQGEGWRPIETCPYHQLVLLWCPENSPWAATVWKGRRSGGDSRNLGYDEGFSIATPYEWPESSHTKQVWCPISRTQFWPTHWMPLPESPAALHPAAASDGENNG